MFEQIDVVNPERVAKALSDWSCGKVEFALINGEDFKIPQYETKPLEGFVFPDGFPLHCSCGKCVQLLKIATDRFASFPNCCEHHGRMNKATWFNKNDYAYLLNKLLATVKYTFHCIGESIDKEDWQAAITEYIEYTAYSYGQFPLGFGSPLGLELYLQTVARNIETCEEIPKEKREAIAAFADGWGKQQAPHSNPADLNILLAAYREWLKLFPFELHTYFGGLKAHFEQTLRFLDGKPETNRYTGLAKSKLVTKERLFESLLNLTNSILISFNGPLLWEKKIVRDVGQIQIDLITQERQQKLKAGYNNSSPDENKRFRRMIKDWLNDEQIYWKKLKPVLSKQLTKASRKADKPQAPVIGLFCWIANESKLLEREQTEAVQPYCKRVCKQFGLPYTDRVRQNFSNTLTKQNTNKLVQEILPSISENHRQQVLACLESKKQPKQKLYA